MKPRLFHAFKFETVLDAVAEVTTRGRGVLFLNKKEDTTLVPALKLRKIDLTKVNRSDEIYTEQGLESLLNYNLNKYELIVLLDHGNRTPHLAEMMSEIPEDVKVISATQRRIVLKRGTDENPGSVYQVDSRFLYNRPEVPDFDILSDAQRIRFAQDGVSSLDDLIPVYDFAVKSFSHHEIVKMSIPERTPLVLLDGVPMLFAESITELYAWRGTGKTLFALALAYHLAAGESFLGMSIPEAVKVLYVEGELPAKQDQERMVQLSAGLDFAEENFTLLSKSFQGRDRDQSPVTIKTEAGRAAIEAELERTEATVLILDSIASLAQISTNNEDNWIPIIEWLVDLRCKGICVIYLQQAGKGGEQRGHSISEDRIDQAIKLTATHTNPGAAAFEVSFHKPRAQGKLDPFRVRCTAGVWERDSSRVVKSSKPKKPTQDEQIREALNSNEPQRKIAKRLNVSLRDVSQIKKELTQHDVPSEATVEQ